MKSYTQLAEAHAALEQLLEVGAMQRQQCDCCFCDEFLMGQEPHDLSSEAAYAVGWVHAGQGPHDLSLAPRTGHAEGAVQGQGSRGWHGRCVCCIQEPGSHKQYHLVRGLISGCQASGRFWRPDRWACAVQHLVCMCVYVCGMCVFVCVCVCVCTAAPPSRGRFLTGPGWTTLAAVRCTVKHAGQKLCAQSLALAGRSRTYVWSEQLCATRYDSINCRAPEMAKAVIQACSPLACYSSTQKWVHWSCAPSLPPHPANAEEVRPCVSYVVWGGQGRRAAASTVQRCSLSGLGPPHCNLQILCGSWPDCRAGREVQAAPGSSAPRWPGALMPSRPPPQAHFDFIRCFGLANTSDLMCKENYVGSESTPSSKLSCPCSADTAE